ncbi:MAG: SDR family oxidoreductase [Acidimicrobiia bacterium]|nr:SDR family oxidoreductase [Acidimicrobiia bacterium]
MTGANHGIGAATARALAERGAAVLVTYLRFDPAEDDPGRPAAYGEARRGGAGEVLEAIRATGGLVEAVEADLADPATPARLFDAAEAAFGGDNGVDILVNNASAWRKDTFSRAAEDRFGRALYPVSAESASGQLLVDARGSALLIAELAQRHVAAGRAWGRIVSLTSGGAAGFPGEVSYGAAKAALENYTMSAATELAPHGITANVVYPPVTDTGWVTPEVEAAVDRVATPDEVAEVIALLCTDAAAPVSGNLIRLR